METEDFMRIISECEFIRDDIDEIRTKVKLTKTEDAVFSSAISSIDQARTILAQLFPNLRSLDMDVREDLEAELAEA